ncbi:NAD(P)-dependent oxidoreductase [Terrabacter carboxydivorans]|uniref:NAD-dependent epimerase/dehydratase domain-containing protein n=1 Tax=Terrabacter carboxydivorans TaxID=619730 RepID=A0ABP5Z2X0_9MICO
MSATGPRPPVSWVVGANGLLGQHVRAALTRRGLTYLSPPIPWGSPDDAEAALAAAAAALVRAADGGPWQVFWCAGAGVTGTSFDRFVTENRMLRTALEALAEANGPEAPGHGDNAVFLASSAGGLYAGSPSAPFDEFSEVVPLSDYGRAKQQAERIVTDWAVGAPARVLVGRIANLYGPGQDLAKPQGLVSQLCAAYLDRRPTQIWVSLDTLRDYLFAPDAGEMVVDAMDLLRRGPLPETAGAGGVVTKIFATQRAVTIGAVLAELRRIFRRRPATVLGASPTSSLQGRDLRLVSRVWPELDRRTLTPFPAGVQATLTDLQLRMQATGRARP